MVRKGNSFAKLLRSFISGLAKGRVRAGFRLGGKVTNSEFWVQFRSAKGRCNFKGLNAEGAEKATAKRARF